MWPSCTGPFKSANAVWQDRIAVQSSPGSGTVSDPYTFKNVSVNGIGLAVCIAGTVSFCGKVWSDKDINIYKNGALLYNIADLYSGAGGVYSFCLGFGVSPGDTIQLGATGNLDFYAVNYTSGSSTDSLKVWWQA